jgi:ATPase family associated with various cellular activities (AAA)
MTLSERLAEFVRAAFAGLWIQSFEHDDAIAEITSLCRRENWVLATWDINRGFAIQGQSADSTAAINASDPLAAIRTLGSLATEDGTTLLVLRNFHKFLNNIEIVQALDSAISAGKTGRTFIVVLSAVVSIPVELERHFVVIEHDLPGRDHLENIARGVATEPGELPTGEGLTAVLDAAAGLTRVEAENAFSLSLVRHNRVTPEVLWELKAQTLKKSGLLSLHRGGETFADLGGLEAVKSFCIRALRPGRRSDVGARGVLLLGPPGSGKSACAKALGNETGRPTLFLDVGSLIGSLIGQSEERTRQALKIADAMAPCVILIDEVEKALSGVGSTGDSGVSSRMFGTLLTYLSDHDSDVFVVASANDISKLPPEFARAERFLVAFSGCTAIRRRTFGAEDGKSKTMKDFSISRLRRRAVEA